MRDNGTDAAEGMRGEMLVKLRQCRWENDALLRERKRMQREIDGLRRIVATVPCQNPRYWPICSAAGDTQESNGFCQDCGECEPCKERARRKEGVVVLRGTDDPLSADDKAFMQARDEWPKKAAETERMLGGPPKVKGTANEPHED